MNTKRILKLIVLLKEQKSRYGYLASVKSIFTNNDYSKICNLIYNLERFVTKFQPETNLTLENECELQNILANQHNDPAIAIETYIITRDSLLYQRINTTFNLKISELELVRLCRVLSYTALLNVDNLEALISYSSTRQISVLPTYLCMLSAHHLLNQPLFDILLQSNNPAYYTDIYIILWKHSLLSEYSYLLDETNENLAQISAGLSLLKSLNLCNQTNIHSIHLYQKFMTTQNALLMAEILVNENRQTLFNTIINLFKSSNDNNHLAHLMLKKLHAKTMLHRAEINYSQSTHNTEVHASASESAIRLKHRYASTALTPEASAYVMLKWLTELPAQPLWSHLYDQCVFIQACINNPTLNIHNQLYLTRAIKSIYFILPIMLRWSTSPATHPNIIPARRAFLHIVQHHLTHIDRESKISTGQLISYVWQALHDKDVLICSVNDAKLRFIDYLSDVKNGSSTICAGGIFNKLVESLNTIHPDVTIRFISKEVIIKKALVVINDQINLHLEAMLDKPNGGQAVLDLLDKLTLETPRGLVEAILPNTMKCLYEEFDTLLIRSGNRAIDEIRTTALLAPFYDKLNLRSRAENLLERQNTKLLAHP